MASVAQECLDTLKDVYLEQGYIPLDCFDAETLGLSRDGKIYGIQELIMVLTNQGRSTYVRIDCEGNEDYVTPGTQLFELDS